MKLRNREINIFSMSALDLFASALGAFILLTVVSLPYFSNTGSSEEDVAKLRKDLSKAKSALRKSQASIKKLKSSMSNSQRSAEQCMIKNRKLRGNIDRCRIALKKKFLLIVASWGTDYDDIDLHVIDPRGREYYYKKKKFPGSRAALEEDSTKGPGNEVWLHPQVEQGTYKVYYKLFRKNKKKPRRRIQIRGAIVTPDGKRKLKKHIMSRVKEKRLIARIKVNSEGKISVIEP